MYVECIFQYVQSLHIAMTTILGLQLYFAVILEINVSRIINLEVQAGSTVMLPCDLDGVSAPGANVTWRTMVGLPLPDNSFITDENVLVITDVTTENIAIYQCMVRTSSGVAGLEYGLVVFGT